MDWIKEKGLYVLNGSMNGDWKGEYKFVSARGNTVIDYVIVNEEAIEKVEEFKIDSRVNSDHMPLKVIWKKEEDRKQEEEIEEEKGEEEEEEERTYIVWDEEAIKKFKKETEEYKVETEEQKKRIEEKWEKLKKKIQAAMTKKGIKIRRKQLGYKDWWDRSCSRKKREVKRIYWK